MSCGGGGVELEVIGFYWKTVLSIINPAFVDQTVHSTHTFGKEGQLSTGLHTK